MSERTYICCDLKSFYASVECLERGLDPLTTNLVVADLSRTEKTICLAVTPSLKAYGISGRARLFEVVQRGKEVNAQRKWEAPGRELAGSSSSDLELKANPSLALDYIVAPPRMAHYIDWSTRVYSVYLKHVAPEDVYPYSIDEVFIQAGRAGVCPPHHPGYPGDHRDHRSRRRWHQHVSGQDSHGHQRKAYPGGRVRRPGG
mgnify:CR=1 FL=1